MDQFINQSQQEEQTAEFRTGKCPVCGKTDLVLNEDGNLPSHAPPDAKYFGSCYYTSKPDKKPAQDGRLGSYGFPDRGGFDR